MASHEHHPTTENKPVAFTIPFILAAVTVIIIVLFLSLCDPSAHDHGTAGGHEPATSASHGEASGSGH